VDLILRRDLRPPVAVVLVDKNPEPALRDALSRILQKRGFEFRPVFLSATLKKIDSNRPGFLLSPTQRDWMHASPFGSADRWFGGPNSLHFLDPETGDWTSLRRLIPSHGVQEYSAKSAPTTSLAHLLWSDRYADWTHPDEPRARQSREGVAALIRRSRVEAGPAVRPADRAALAPGIGPVGPGSTERLSTSGRECQSEVPRVRRRRVGDDRSVDGPAGPAGAARVESAPAEPDPWVAGLLCVGCGTRTMAWQRGVPSEDRCVCRACASKGVAL